MRKKIITSLLLVSSLMLGLAGCGSKTFVTDDVTSYKLVNALTEQELIDYYAKALDYDSVITRNIVEDKAVYVTRDIDGTKAERLKELVAKSEAILLANEYENNPENAKIVDESVYNYIKASIDNYYLTEPSIQQIKGALGYYFVDVKYNLNPRELGTFNNLTPLIGIDGVFTMTATGRYGIDIAYMNTICKILNNYYLDNNIFKAALFDTNTISFDIYEGDPKEALEILKGNGSALGSEFYDPNKIPGSSDLVMLPDGTEDNDGTENTDGTEDVENTDSVVTDGIEGEEETTETPSDSTEVIPEATPAPEVTPEVDYSTVVLEDRQITLDTDFINSIVGTSLKQKAFLPGLNTVYNIPEPQGVICGHGIYSAGGNGMRVFGLDRSKLTGEIVIRYVFKDAVDGTTDILGSNIFIIEESVNSGFNVSSNTLVIPEFVKQQLEIMVERSDRVIVNGDLTGLMSGNVYQDMGFAVLRGYKELDINILKYMSTIRQIIARDQATNSYLIEVETTTEEGAKSPDVYGIYKDKYYVVIQQQGTKFYIVDSIRMSREVIEEPAINPDDATTKRLVALNLAGEVDDIARDNCTKLLSNWYTASTNRVLRASTDPDNPKKIVVDGQEIVVNYGMYDCFQSDTSMLSNKDLEYMQSELRGKLDMHGYGTSVIYNGIVTEWIGGADNQVEFITEELITYAGREEAYYMQVYYLVSNMNDAWVIDERKVIDERAVKGAELTNISERIN